MLSLLTCLLLSPSAQAVPLQITQQGRMIDASGAAVDGSQIVVFRVYDAETGGNQLWEEYLTVQFNNGYYATVLGVDESGNPLDSETLSLYPVFLEIQLNSNPPMSPRQSINSTPYAQIAGVAESVEGGKVNASEVQISSSPVIDGNRNWVGEPITVDWSSIQNVPAELQDGDNDTQLSESEVENFVTNGSLSLHEDTTLNGQEILTLGNDSDTLADISCSDGDVPKWDAVVGQWDCGLDNDTLADLNCAAGELAKFDGTNWSCGEDVDTVLDADTVISYVEQNSLSIPAGSQIDGADILTSADTLEPEWTDIQNRPNGLDDGDDDTQLSQSEVVGYVESGSVNLASGSQVNSRNIVGQPSVCTGGQVLVYNASSNDWECGDDTDTTLTESEMQTMIEAMTLNFQNRPQVSGADVLTTDSTLDPTKIDASSANDGQVLVSNGGNADWGEPNNIDSCKQTLYTHSESGAHNILFECDGFQYVNNQSGNTNIFQTSETCTTSFIENTSNSDIYSLIDCESSSHIVSGDYQSNLIVKNMLPSRLNGNFHCAIKTDDTVECWGQDNYGQVSSSPTGTFSSLSAGLFYTCGLTTSGTVQCWGNDSDGVISNTPSDNFIEISSRNTMTCGITTAGTIECWGGCEILDIPSSDTFISLSIGSCFGCGITTSGNVECWGGDFYGQSSPPNEIFTQIVSGKIHSCGITSSQTVVCWGDDSYNQVSNTPSGMFSSLSVGENHTCGITTSGNVKCWGRDFENQVSDVPNGVFSQMASGRNHTCALDTLGKVQCWGNYSALNKVPVNGNFIALHANLESTCGILDSGNILCWGSASHNQTSPP